MSVSVMLEGKEGHSIVGGRRMSSCGSGGDPSLLREVGVPRKVGAHGGEQVGSVRQGTVQVQQVLLRSGIPCICTCT